MTFFVCVLVCECVVSITASVCVFLSCTLLSSPFLFQLNEVKEADAWFQWEEQVIENSKTSLASAASDARYFVFAFFLCVCVFQGNLTDIRDHHALADVYSDCARLFFFVMPFSLPVLTSLFVCRQFGQSFFCSNEKCMSGDKTSGLHQLQRRNSDRLSQRWATEAVSRIYTAHAWRVSSLIAEESGMFKRGQAKSHHFECDAKNGGRAKVVGEGDEKRMSTPFLIV
jgi:hypothetical protein